jgi:hypothetical protein
MSKRGGGGGGPGALATSHNESFNESHKSSIHNIQKTIKKNGTFGNGSINSSINDKGLDLRKVYKTT